MISCACVLILLAFHFSTPRAHATRTNVLNGDLELTGLEEGTQLNLEKHFQRAPVPPSGLNPGPLFSPPLPPPLEKESQLNFGMHLERAPVPPSGLNPGSSFLPPPPPTEKES